MEFVTFSRYLSKLEQTASRLEMTEILAELFNRADELEIGPVVNLSLGQLRPKFNKLEFSLAEKMVMRAIAQAARVDASEVLASYKQIGDLGEVFERFMQRAENMELSEQLTILEVFEKLEIIAADSGHGSQERKINSLAELLANLDKLSAKYLVRMVLGKLRLGFSDMTIIDALSYLVHGDKSGRNQLESAYQLSPDIGDLAQLVKTKKTTNLVDSIEIKLGVPVIPALAQRLKTAQEMIDKMGQVYVDPKYDGQRVQIHFKRQGFENKQILRQSGTSQSSRSAQDDKLGMESLLNLSSKVLVKTFTRNLDETSHMFPELAKLGDFIQADEVILDAEAMGYDPKTGRLLPFQQTIQRKRKHGIAELAQSIPLKFFVFDILYKNGQSLIREPLSERYRILHETVKDSQLIEATEFILTDSADEIRAKHADLLAQGLEGAMVKKHNGSYKPGRKGWSWVKFKEAEGSAAKLSDTIDALVMGLYVGKGKRTEFGVGAFLIGLRAETISNSDKVTKWQSSRTLDEFEEGKFYTISKVGTGLTDDQWRELATRSEVLRVESKPKEYEVDKNLEPDIWLDPGLVVEIAADEITKSPIHTAGLALRFPRLVKFRDDKNPQQATSVEELKEMV